MAPRRGLVTLSLAPCCCLWTRLGPLWGLRSETPGSRGTLGLLTTTRGLPFPLCASWSLRCASLVGDVIVFVVLNMNRSVGIGAIMRIAILIIVGRHRVLRRERNIIFQNRNNDKEDHTEKDGVLDGYHRVRREIRQHIWDMIYDSIDEVELVDLVVVHMDY